MSIHERDGFSNAKAPRAAVLGGGVSGITCAGALAEAGWDVTVFEKSRGIGGRASTRREGNLTFDHGAPCFSEEGGPFAETVNALLGSGSLAPWSRRTAQIRRGRIEFSEDCALRYVGVPGMSSLPRRLSRGLRVLNGREVSEVRVTGSGSELHFKAGESEIYPLVIVAVPAPQAAVLVSGIDFLSNAVSRARFSSGIVAMAAFSERLDVPFDDASVDGSDLSRVIRDASKPGRGDSDCWVLHGSPEFVERRLEEDSDESAERLLSEFSSILDRPLPEAIFSSGHRWRYARTTKPYGESYAFDSKAGVGVVGDWCLGDGIEEAYASGAAMANHLLEVSGVSS